jgi:hypothetical protein
MTDKRLGIAALFLIIEKMLVGRVFLVLAFVRVVLLIQRRVERQDLQAF